MATPASQREYFIEREVARDVPLEQATARADILEREGFFEKQAYQINKYAKQPGKIVIAADDPEADFGLEEYLMLLEVARNAERAGVPPSAPGEVGAVPNSIAEVRAIMAANLGYDSATAYTIAANKAGLGLDFFDDRVGRKGESVSEVRREAKERGMRAFQDVQTRAEMDRVQSIKDMGIAKLSTLGDPIPPALLGMDTDTPVVVSDQKAGFFGSGPGLLSSMGLAEEDKLEEISQPGEAGYNLAAYLVQTATTKDENLIGRIERYGKLEQGWETMIKERTEELMETHARDVSMGTGAYDEIRKDMWKRALRELAIYKTVGLWSMPIFIPMSYIESDGQISDDRNLWDAWSPTVEVIGMNNDMQVVVRQEGIVQYLFEVADSLQSGTVGMIMEPEKEWDTAFVEGVAKRRNIFEAAWEHYEPDSWTAEAWAVGGGGLLGAMFFPDLFLGGAGLAKLANRGVRAAKLGKATTRSNELLTEAAKAYAAGDTLTAVKAEAALHREYPVVWQFVNWADTKTAEHALSKANPDIMGPEGMKLAKSLPDDLGEDLLNLHPAHRRHAIKPKVKGAPPHIAHTEVYDYHKVLKRIDDAIERVKAQDPTMMKALLREPILKDKTIMRKAVAFEKTLLAAGVDAAVAASFITKLRDSLHLAIIDPIKWRRGMHDDIRAIKGLEGTPTETIITTTKEVATRKVLHRILEDIEKAALNLGRRLEVGEEVLKALNRARQAIHVNIESRAIGAAFVREAILGAQNKKAPPIIPSLMAKAEEIPDLSEEALQLASMFEKHHKLNRTSALLSAMIVDARSKTWADETGREAIEFYATRIAGVKNKKDFVARLMVDHASSYSLASASLPAGHYLKQNNIGKWSVVGRNDDVLSSDFNDPLDAAAEAIDILVKRGVVKKSPLDDYQTRVGPMLLGMELPLVETAIKSERVEHLVAYSSDGLHVVRKIGDEGSVPITKQEILNMARSEDMVVTHNHPSAVRGGGNYASMLSGADISVAALIGAREIRATSPMGTWTLEVMNWKNLSQGVKYRKSIDPATGKGDVDLIGAGSSGAIPGYDTNREALSFMTEVQLTSGLILGQLLEEAKRVGYFRDDVIRLYNKQWGDELQRILTDRGLQPGVDFRFGFRSRDPDAVFGPKSERALAQPAREAVQRREPLDVLLEVDEAGAKIDRMAAVPGAAPSRPTGIPGVSASEFEGVVEGFKDAAEAARYLAGTADDASYRLIASRIVSYLDDVEIRVLSPGDKVPRGYGASRGAVYHTFGADPTTPTVMALQNKINVKKPVVFLSGTKAKYTGMDAETLTHELLHAATSQRLRLGRMPSSKGTDLADAAADFEDLLKVVIPRWQEVNAGGWKIGPPRLNAEELLAWGMTNKKFQDFLADIKLPRGVGAPETKAYEQTVFSKFVAIVGRLIGIKVPKSPTAETTALMEVIRLTDNILDVPVDHAARQAWKKHRESVIEGRAYVWDFMGAEAVPVEASFYEGRMQVGRVVFDSEKGMGNVPDNANVAYKGFVVWMTPQEFLSLNPARAAEAAADVVAETTRRIDAGEAIAPPFLTVKQADEGFRVRSHEGRGRMLALAEIQPDIPVPVHVFGRGRIDRATDITPEMLESLVDPARTARLLPDTRAKAGADVKPRAAWHVPSGDRYDPGKVYRSPTLEARIDRMEAGPPAPPTPAGRVPDARGSDEILRSATEFMSDGRAWIYALEKPDVASVINSLGHIFRRDLKVADMDLVTDWLKTNHALSVGHDAGRFTGDANTIARAEDMFAKAFQVYVMEGRTEAKALTKVFDKLKGFLTRVYHHIRNSDISAQVKMTPEMRKIFDRLLYGSRPSEAILPTAMSIVKREVLGPAKPTGAGKGFGRRTYPGIFEEVASEAERLGIAGATLKDLEKQYSAWVQRGRKLDDAVFTLERPILHSVFPKGKKAFTEDDLALVQGILDEQRIVSRAMRDPDIALLTKTESVKESDFLQRLYQMTSSSSFAARTGRAAVGTMFGGDPLAKMRLLPPVIRQAILAGTRQVEHAYGEVFRIAGESAYTGDWTNLHRFLGGESGIVYEVGGRQVLSSGYDAFGAVMDDIGHFVKNPDGFGLNARHLDALEYVSTKMAPGMNHQRNFTKMATRAEEIKVIKDGEEVTKRVVMAAPAFEAVAALLYHGDDFFKNVRKALGLPAPNVVAGKMVPDLTYKEYRLAEVLTYHAGVTQRAGKTITGEPTAMSKSLFDDLTELYGQDRAVRVMVLLAGHGHAHRGRQTWISLGIAVDRSHQAAFKSYLHGEAVSPELMGTVKAMTRRFGLNPHFFEDGSLSTRFYVPAAAREKMSDALARGILREPNMKMLLTKSETEMGNVMGLIIRYMKLRMTRGAFILRQRYFFMNTFDHFNQMAMVAGFRPAFASTTRLVVGSDLLVLPFFQRFMWLLSKTPIIGKKIPPHLIETFRRGMQKGGDVAAGAVRRLLAGGRWRVEVNPILEGRSGTVRIGGRMYSFTDIRNIAIQEGIFASFDTSQLANAVKRTNEMYAEAFYNAQKKGVVKGGWYKFKQGMVDWMQMTTDAAEAWAERERLGAMVTLMEFGMDPRTAARVTIDAIYDYAGSMSKADRAWWVSIVLPFWAFQKNANAQVVRQLFSPWGAYRMGVIRRAHTVGSDALSTMLYESMVDPYGVDTTNMSEATYQNYYALRKVIEFGYGKLDALPQETRDMIEHRFGKPISELTEEERNLLENGYGGPKNVPDDVRTAMTMLFAGRSYMVEDGKEVTLHSVLVRARELNNIGTAGRYLPRPDPAGRPTWIRDRPGLAVPFPMTENVTRYMSLYQLNVGPDYPYTMMLLPDSTVNAGMRHVSSVIAMGLIIGDSVIGNPFDEAPEDELGIDLVYEKAFMTNLKNVIDIERAPIAGEIMDLYTHNSQFPRRVHPSIASTLEDTFNIKMLRINAVEDPFVREAEELELKLGEASGMVKQERYYLLPGFWTLAFDNSPLGELNRKMFELERSALEMTDQRGDLLAWARFVLGIQTVEVHRSRQARLEEPTTLIKSRGLPQ